MPYFENSGMDGFVLFNGRPIPACRSPNCFDILKELEMTSEQFVDKANALFDKHRVRVPEDYPKECTVKSKMFGDPQMVPGNDIAICVGCCILIEDQFGFDVSKIVKNELIGNNSRSGIHHACTMAALVLHFLKNGANVQIRKEKANQQNPDLVIDGFDCEIKAIDESDWTAEIKPATGKGPSRKLSEDICYDIGQFIAKKNSGHKGIKQADVVFADLSLKSFGWIDGAGWITENNPGLPPLQKYRMIYLAREIIYFRSFFLDLEPRLWQFIKNCETKHSFAVLGAPSGDGK